MHTFPSFLVLIQVKYARKYTIRYKYPLKNYSLNNV